jgi:hypothetical protein
MNTSLRLIEGIKQKFADEVHETNMLDTAEKKIIEYFTAIGERTEEEFKKAKSLKLEINPKSYNFLYIRIKDTGLSFYREDDYIIVYELLEDGEEREYDRIYVKNKIVVTSLYPRVSFTMDILNKYVEHLFEEYLA